MEHRDDDAWVAELTGQQGPHKQAEAFQDLGQILFTCIHWYLSSRAALPPTLASGSRHDLDELAQDIVQESLERIWRVGLGSYRKQAHFLTFAKAIAINQARQRLRHMWRRRDEPWPLSEEDEMEQDSPDLPVTGRSEIVMQEQTPEKRAMITEVQRCVERSLKEQCTPREREAFVKRYVDGLSSKEAAQAMKTTERAVNMLTFNARKRLREGLEAEGYTLETTRSILEE